MNDNNMGRRKTARITMTESAGKTNNLERRNDEQRSMHNEQLGQVSNQDKRKREPCQKNRKNKRDGQWDNVDKDNGTILEI